jgi:hypothetical protein
MTDLFLPWLKRGALEKGTFGVVVFPALGWRTEDPSSWSTMFDMPRA